MTLFENAAHVPLIIAKPGNPANGQTCERPVELVDLHRTLADLCGIPAPEKADGFTLRSLIENPKAEWEHPAFTQIRRPGEKGPDGKASSFEGWSVRTERWRYTEWDGGTKGVELYDHNVDPREMKNLGGDPKQAENIAQLKKLLDKQRAEK